MRVRVATRLDEQPVLDVLRADGDATGRQPSKARLAEVRATLRSPGALTLVADDGAVVGVLLAELARAGVDREPVPPGLLQLSLLCVAPAARRRGTATALVRSLLDRFGHVAVWAPDGAPRSLLEREGFTPTGRTREAGGEVVAELRHQPR